MEQPPEPPDRVRIPTAVFDGLEVIRRSGLTNMLDRRMVLHLAREWDFTDTADWIEAVDSATYARLIFQGPEVIEDDLPDPEIDTDLDHPDSDRSPSRHGEEDEAMHETTDNDAIEMALDTVRREMHELIATLGKQAILTIVDTYHTDDMGVPLDRSRRDLIAAERLALIRSLGHASSVWLQLEKTLIEVQRGIGSLHYLTDPENN